MSYIEMTAIKKIFPGMQRHALDHITLQMDKGEIVTLLGPSGCGKTTTLRMIAGFELPDAGEIRIDGETVCNESFSLPPEKRGIGMVFQDYALFPHLTVEKNVLFGLKGWKRAQRKKRVREVLELVGLSEYAARYPYELSGGQQQRVALARALAPRPKVILLDEPFSNLDVNLREKMRIEVHRILREAETTAIFVTHDQKDAFAVSDRIVVMNEGRIEQVDEPKQLYRYPNNRFVAEFLGKTNLLTGKLASDQKHVFTCIGKVCLSECINEPLDQVTLSIRPEGCRLKKNGRYCGLVENVTYCGEYQEVHVYFQSDHQTVQSMVIYAEAENELKVGDRVQFDIAPELVSLVAEEKQPIASYK